MSGSLPAGAERKLAICVMAMAIDDVVRNRDSTDRGSQSTYYQARSWFTSGDRKWPYSFLNLCDLLGLPAARVRRAALSRRTPVRLFDDAD